VHAKELFEAVLNPRRPVVRETIRIELLFLPLAAAGHLLDVSALEVFGLHRTTPLINEIHQRSIRVSIRGMKEADTCAPNTKVAVSYLGELRAPKEILHP